MKSSFFGWSIIILICLIPVFLLIFFGPSISFTYADLTHKFGQLAALLGFTVFSMTFILSTRIGFIEDIFGGLDKVYIVHGILGGTALILLLFHPILLVLKFIPENISKAAAYLGFSSHWSVNFGIIAILGLISLIYFTLYTKIKYHHWKFSHEFLGLVFIIAILHVFLVRGDASRDYIFSGYYLYITLVSIIGLGGFSYSLFIKDRMLQEAVFTIEKIAHVDKRKQAYELVLAPESKPLSYQSGQFIFVRFYNEHLSRESHPFSIASRSNDPRIKIIVKTLGDFTNDIHKLKIGDRVSVEGPYGRFSFVKSSLDQVWIAGGIGITPFLGMAQDINKKTWLFYSSKDENDFVSLDDLNKLAGKNFFLTLWDTSRQGYITFEDIKKKIGSLDKEFLISGPHGFKSSLIRQLRNAGVPASRIHEEDFSFK